MKKITINPILYILLFAASVSSCSKFLDIEPKTALTEEKVFADINNIEPLVIGLYNQFSDVKKGRGSLMFNFGVDEIQGGKRQLIENPQHASMDSYLGLIPSNERLAEQWSSRWPVVTAAAKAIYALSLTKQEPARAKQLLGEASFVRATLTFELAMLWGEVPIIDMSRSKELGYGRQPLKDVWAFIINDLEIASGSLPSSQGDKKRATSGAALAMLGKAYMSAPTETGLRDFAKAKECFEKMMSSYTLTPSFAELWDVTKPNTSESIYEFQFRKGWPDCNHWMNDLGSGAVANAWGMGSYFAGWDLLLPTKYAYSALSDGGIWEEGDQRRAQSIRYDFTYNGKVTPPYPTGTGDELDPHIKKFEDIRTDGPGGNSWESGKHFAFLRLGDIILCYAECLNELGQTSEAIAQVNDKIRTRAWGGNLPVDKRWPSMSQDEFRTKILDERMRELCFEGWRRQDLIRTGNFVKLIKERNESAKKAGAIQPFHVRYPIPDTEIKGNEDMSIEDQNAGYK